MKILELYARIDGSRVEGRLENVVQRQKEIQKIHSSIQKAAGQLTEAILADGTFWSKNWTNGSFRD